MPKKTVCTRARLVCLQVNAINNKIEMKTEQTTTTTKNGKCSANKMRNGHRPQTDEERSGLSSRYRLNVWKKPEPLIKFIHKGQWLFSISRTHVPHPCTHRCGQLWSKVWTITAAAIRHDESVGYSLVEHKTNVVQKWNFWLLARFIANADKATIHECCVMYAHF